MNLMLVSVIHASKARSLKLLMFTVMKETCYDPNTMVVLCICVRVSSLGMMDFF